MRGMNCGVKWGVCCGLLLLLTALCLVPASPGLAADEQSISDESQLERQRKELAEEKELIQLFADTLEQVKSRYVESDVSERELIEAAIRGMISRLDPYSNYIAPNDLDQFRKGVEREYVGIGIQVSDRDGYLQVTCPLFDTPAWRAGLRAGDRILKIDDTSTRGLSIDDAIKLMGGQEGTEVSVTILHHDAEKAETVKLKRERIEQPTVIGYYRDAAGQWDYFCDPSQRIAYVRITAFSGSTARDLRRVLKQLLDQNMEGLVLDLRFNPGGMLNQAIEVCDLFLREGRIVSVEGRGTPPQTWDAKSPGTIIPQGFPLVMMVNRFSASAAEIVSACLQDNHAATIVGERTWGKGSVQKIIELDHGQSALKLTTAGYHRPSGQNIHREVGAGEEEQWGVHPDPGCEIRLSNRDLGRLGTLYDQRDELTKVQRRGDAEKPSADTGEEPSGAGDASDVSPQLTDAQLEKSLEILRRKIVERKQASHTPESAAGGGEKTGGEKAGAED